jgi:predicted dehydrogenase
MKNLRYGIVGLGNIGRQHAETLLSGKVARAVLAAAVSSTEAKRQAFAARGVKTFSVAEEMFRAGVVDAVIVATPHYQHLPLGVAALECGLHLLVEKPIAAQKVDAEILVAAHARHPQLVFGGFFQKRAEPCFQRMRELIQRGELGSLVRVSWLTTDWFRGEAYYRSSAWRATWAGEGGGVLINQALHNLDMLAWLVGQPLRVCGFCGFGKFHDIEVEDEATAYLEWPGGATGTFIACSGEAPGTNRLEISGTRGRLVLENNRLTLTRNAADAQEFSRIAADGFAKPMAATEEIPFTVEMNPHAALLQNFTDAVLAGAPLLAPGAEGIYSVELANAVVYSALRGETVALPLDGAAWAQRLKELISSSTRK